MTGQSEHSSNTTTLSDWGGTNDIRASTTFSYCHHCYRMYDVHGALYEKD